HPTLARAPIAQARGLATRPVAGRAVPHQATGIGNPSDNALVSPEAGDAISAFLVALKFNEALVLADYCIEDRRDRRLLRHRPRAPLQSPSSASCSRPGSAATGVHPGAATPPGARRDTPPPPA